MLGNLEFFIVEAFRSFRRGALMSTVAIGTITVSLTILGLFLLLIINMGNIVATISSRLDLVAFSSKTLSLDEAAAVQVRIAKLPGVEKVEFTSKTEAWNKFRNDFGQKLDLQEVIHENPLPHTFAVSVRTPELLPQIAKEISNLEVIDEVRYSGKLIEQMKALVGAVRVGGIILVILLSFATLLIVVNTIRLTVLARETDIYIMKLVGATDTFVKWPFIIESLLIGVVGGLSSFLVLKVAYESSIAKIASALPFLPLVTEARILWSIYFIVFIGGVTLGMLGGYISVSRVLKKEGS